MHPARWAEVALYFAIVSLFLNPGRQVVGILNNMFGWIGSGPAELVCAFVNPIPWMVIAGSLTIIIRASFK